MLELVGLSEYADRAVVALSGGQMQRVALARSIVYRPQLLLLDEPLSNLDAKLRLRLRDDLRRIIKQAGMTALYVTHDQAEAVVLGDRIGVMRDGKLLQMATPDEIYNRPADLFVANFTGATNDSPAPGRAQRRVRHCRFRRRQSRRGDAAAWRGPRREGARRVAAGNYSHRRHSGANTFAARVPTAATRARRPSMTSTCSATGWKRSNSAPRAPRSRR